MVRDQRALAAVVAIVVVSFVVAASLYASPGPAAGSTTSTTTSASSYTFSPSSPLQVSSVSAQTTKDNATGKVYLTLSVTYKNVGSEAVYVTRGCGSSLS